MKNLLYLLLTCLLPLGLLAQSTFQTTPALISGVSARHLGPAVMSGRISTIAVHPTQPEIIYIGAAGGGIWKTVSAGGQVRPIFDDHTQSIGKIAIAPSNPKIIYVGTGEPWTRNSVSVGTGVYKSDDEGATWTNIGLASSERISDIIVHPTNPDVAYVAALGHLWNANEERGVFKTTDGGKTWNKVLYTDENTGASSLDFDPTNPDIVYATLWSFRRQPWTFDSGFTGGSAVYKSIDGGANWQKIHNGLPSGKLGRMAIAAAPSNGSVLYLSVECEKAADKGLYRSENAGESWTKVSTDFNTTVRPFYFSNLTIDPKNDSIVMKCGLYAIISEDSGTTFRTMDQSVHSDVHDIWIDPSNTKHVLVATDGGLYESLDRGYTFKMWMNLPLSQFYHVAVDQAVPFNVYGGLQDNGSWYGPSRKAGGVGNKHWEPVFGGDGFYVLPHPTDENTIFAEYQGGNLVRYNKQTGMVKYIAPYASGSQEKLRFNWNSPLASSAAKPGRMYYGSQYLFMSDDKGDSWKAISPDLTTDNPDKQRQFESGGLSIDNSTAENHCTIYTIADSPKDVNIIWVGTDDGNLQVTENGGNNWNNVTINIPGLPANTWVTYVAPSPHDARTCFVTFDGHRTGDQQTYLYKTTDLGATWTRLADTAVEGYALSVRQDLENPSLLFLGTEFGLYISLDAGASWARFSNNMPKVGVRDMVIHPRDHALVMATHGRGIILIDDIRPLRKITSEMVAQDLVFLPAPPTLLSDPGAGGDWFGGSGNYVAGNPSNTAKITYYLKKRHTFGKMYFEIFKDGQFIRTIQAGKSAGINIVEMPTSLEKPRSAPTKNTQALFGSIFGPNMPAGVYDVRLIKGKDTLRTSFELAYDPASLYPAAERVEQQKLAMQLYTMSEDMAYYYEVIHQINQQADAVEGQKKSLQAKLDGLANKTKQKIGELISLEGDGYVNETEKIRESISNLYTKVNAFPGQPSTPQVLETQRLQAELVALQSWIAALQQTDVAAVNALLAKAGQAAITWPDKAAFLSSDKGETSGGGLRFSDHREVYYHMLRTSPNGRMWSLGWMQ